MPKRSNFPHPSLSGSGLPSEVEGLPTDFDKPFRGDKSGKGKRGLLEANPAPLEDSPLDLRQNYDDLMEPEEGISLTALGAAVSMDGEQEALTHHPRGPDMQAMAHQAQPLLVAHSTSAKSPSPKQAAKPQKDSSFSHSLEKTEDKPKDALKGVEKDQLPTVTLPALMLPVLTTPVLENQKPAALFNEKVTSLFQAQTEAAFTFWNRLVAVRSLTDIITLQTQTARLQYDLLTAHMKDFVHLGGSGLSATSRQIKLSSEG